MQRKPFMVVLTIVALLVLALPLGSLASSGTPPLAADTVANPALPSALDAKLASDGPVVPTGAPANPAAILYDNGPLVTNPGAGSGGADASAVQTALGNGTYGFGHQVLNGNRVADDFVVPSPGWNVTTITFYAYQTGSTTTSTMTAVNLRIWDGPPGVGGSTVVFGDTTTNRLASSTFSNIYRVLDTGLLDTARPIMASVATVSTSLAPGTYWVDWSSDGTLGSGPWAPPVTILGQTNKPGANGQQSVAGGPFATAIDTGNSTPQDFPFIIEGALAEGPSISLVKTVGTTAGVCAATSSITVPAGTTVYYCYTVTNTGDTAFTTHDLSDDQLGSIFTGTSYALAPGASVSTVDLGLTISAVINTTTTNVGTWTAHTATGAPSQAQSTATVTAVQPRCQMGYHEVPVLSEGFDGTFPPAGWTVANTTTGCTGIPDWTNTDPGARGNLTGGAGAFAVADSDACGSSSVMNTEMWSSMLDLTNLTNPLVTYYTDYNDLSSTNDVADLDVSTDGGTSWSNLISWNEDHRGPLQVEQAFPGDGQNDVLLRWNYTNAIWDWWWEVDDVAITACAPDNPTAVDVSNISASPVAPVAGFPLAAIPAALTAAAAAAWVARKRFSR